MKNEIIHFTILSAVVVLLIASAPVPVWAYVGPGAGLTVIGAALAFIGAIFLAIVGFIWYPIKRLLRGRAASRAKSANTAADNATR